MTRAEATLVVLAGGEAKRLGFPKHELVIDGERIVDRLHRRLGPSCFETVVVGRDLDAVPRGARLVEDRFVVRSPLVGIHAGLAAARTDLTVVVACDMPYVEPSLLTCLLDRADGVDVVVPVVRGYYEPLFAVYRTTCLQPIERMIERGTLKVSELYPLVDVHEVDEVEVRLHDPRLRSFANLNVPAEIEEVA